MSQKTKTFIRISMFIIYFWFGALKALGLSPAEKLVQALFESTLGLMLPFLTFSVFFILFAIFECLIGILFLIKGAERLALFLTLLHIFTTALPLVFLPEYAWSGFMVLTLAGQYIVKNLLIVSSAISLVEASPKK